MTKTTLKEIKILNLAKREKYFKMMSLIKKKIVDLAKRVKNF